jgi:hypothetical protein
MDVGTLVNATKPQLTKLQAESGISAGSHKKRVTSMRKANRVGELVDGFDIPVLNEREIRAAAGIFFVAMFIAVMLAALKGDFLLLKYVIIMFSSDIYVRVFASPKFSPSLIIGRLIVRNQVPEFVSARQKKFAWTIGTVLATIAFLLIVVVNSFSPITGLICFVCLMFLFFETAFGICLGCLFYGWLYKEKAQYCPGEICDTTTRHEIQKTSKMQILIAFGFVAYILLTVYVFHDSLMQQPRYLFGMFDPTQPK